MHCSTGLGKMHSSLLSGALHHRLTAGLCHWKYNYGHLQLFPMHQGPVYGKQSHVPGRLPPVPGPRDRHAQRPRGFGAWCRASGDPLPARSSAMCSSGTRAPARAKDAALAPAWPGATDAPGPLTDLSVAASHSACCKPVLQCSTGQ